MRHVAYQTTIIKYTECQRYILKKLYIDRYTHISFYIYQLQHHAPTLDLMRGVIDIYLEIYYVISRISQLQEESLTITQANMLLYSTFPFLLHALLELPAGINFLLRPYEQLSSPAPQAHSIIRQYGVLLLVSAGIALIFAARPVDGTSRNVAGALALYHLLPMNRAWVRVAAGESHYGKGLGGPRVHLTGHLICLASLVQVAVRARF